MKQRVSGSPQLWSIFEMDLIANALELTGCCTRAIAIFDRSRTTLSGDADRRIVTIVMSIAEIRQPPLAEKLKIMEAIWEDLRAQAEQVPVPAWHKELLDERRKAVEEGREQVFDWDSIKDSLGSHNG
jgi:hypothetical protein